MWYKHQNVGSQLLNRPETVPQNCDHCLSYTYLVFESGPLIFLSVAAESEIFQVRYYSRRLFVVKKYFEVFKKDLQ